MSVPVSAPAPTPVSAPNPVLTRAQHVPRILRLGLPLVGGHLAQFAIGATDTAMMGWYGVPELAALTVAASFFFLFFIFGAGFAFAVMPMVAAASERRDAVEIRRVTRMALWLSMLYFVLVFPLFWWSEPLLQMLRQTDQVSALGQAYLRIAYWGMAPALGVMVLKNYLAGLEKTDIVLGITIVAALCNAGLNYVLIFGNLGAPEMGIAGAALASVCVNLLACAMVAVYAARALPEHTLFVRLWRPDLEILARVFRVGLPISFTTLAEVSLFSGAAVLMGWLGEVPLAAHGIALQIAAMTFLVHLGLSNAATIRAGQAAGRGDVVHLRRGAEAVLMISACAVVLATILFLTAPGVLIGLFLDPDNPQRAAILSLGASLLAVAALFQLVDAAQVMFLGLLRGLEDTQVPMLMAVLSYWAVGMPVAYGLGIRLGLGPVGIWFGLVAGLSLASVLLGWRFYRVILPRFAPPPESQAALP